MVEIYLLPEEYEMIEKWFGMLFGNKGKKNPKKEEVALYQKLAFMHIAEMQEELREKETEGED